MIRRLPLLETLEMETSRRGILDGHFIRYTVPGPLFVNDTDSSVLETSSGVWVHANVMSSHTGCTFMMSLYQRCSAGETCDCGGV